MVWVSGGPLLCDSQSGYRMYPLPEILGLATRARRYQYEVEILALANWSLDVVWGFCSALLGSWFILGDLLALRGEVRDRKAQLSIINPVITPVRYGIYVVALAMGTALWLSVWDLVFARSQALYVLGLMVLLAIAAVEFLFFIGLVLQRDHEQ